MHADRLLPSWHVASRHETRVAAEPDQVWRALLDVDLADSRLIRMLFRLRGLTARSMTWEVIERRGFVHLVDDPPRERVYGLVARPWRLRGPIVHISATDFEAFIEEGYAKVVWSFAIEPGAQESTLATVTRVWCTDEVSHRRFRRYWRLVGPFSGIVRREILRLVREAAMRGV